MTDKTTDYWYQGYATSNSNQQFVRKQTPMETTVVGVTFEGRQSIVALLKVGEDVLLVREPTNRFDRNAIKVVRKNGQCFGYINKDLAAILAQKLDKHGAPIEATVKTLRGRQDEDSKLGVSIEFIVPGP